MRKIFVREELPEIANMNIEILKTLGFSRKLCSSCGSPFWTLDSDRKTCGDTDCDGYSFIGEKVARRSYNNNEMRSLFLDYFKKDHTFMEPYPVVPRWREDVLLVNASIYDFQPHVTSGMVKPPANPIVMSQPCVRMVDVDLVGETGRHLTSFEMMCHDSFNSPKESVYWIDGTVERSYNFLEDALGVEPELITYKENPWSGGGNGGEAVEVFAKGLEVATLVFMDMKLDPSGPTEIDGEHYSKMGMQIVDTGYGLERLSWLTYGTPTIYDFLYPDIIRQITETAGVDPINDEIMEKVTNLSSKTGIFGVKELAKSLHENDSRYSVDQLIGEIRHAKAIYTIADHTRSALFMLSNHVIPSNVKVGYLARILIRRSLRNLSVLGVDNIVEEIMEQHSRNFSGILKNVPWDFVHQAVTEEAAKYDTALTRGESIVSRIIGKSGTISTQDALKLYDSHGLDPETISRIAEKHGTEIRIPSNFQEQIVQLHNKGDSDRKAKEQFPEIETRPLYYDDTGILDFTAIVLYSKNKKVILNQTAFYPEGGGQPCDFGFLQFGKKKVEVKYVEKKGKTIIHHLSEDIPERTRVSGHVEAYRRRRLMLHHSATHLLLAVTREILGEHVWQAGAQKGVEESRIDVTHFSKLTPEEIEKIEKRCLEYIMEGRTITVRNMDWYKAVDKYGFTLFQGGTPLDSKLRVVEIDRVDAEGCGGTHMKNTNQLGFIKIIRADSVQEGIQRLIFCAGDAAMSYTQKLYGSMRSIQSTLGTDVENTHDAFEKVYRENIDQAKHLEAMRKEKVNALVSGAETFSKSGIAIRLVQADLDQEEFNLITKIVAQVKDESTIIASVSEDKHLYAVVDPSGKIFERLDKISKDLDFHTRNKFIYRFSTAKDAKSLINFILNV